MVRGAERWQSKKRLQKGGIRQERKNEKRCSNGVPKHTQTREHIKLKVNIQSLIYPTSFHNTVTMHTEISSSFVIKTR